MNGNDNKLLNAIFSAIKQEYDLACREFETADHRANEIKMKLANGKDTLSYREYQNLEYTYNSRKETANSYYDYINELKRMECFIRNIAASVM